MNCKCGQPSKKLTVKKDGVNKGRQFYTCIEKQCEFFKWDTVGYDIRNFREGTCKRCGRWKCNADTCKEQRDYYENIIPNNDNDFNNDFDSNDNDQYSNDG